MNTAILIPARLSSSRFPNKLVQKLTDKTLIEHVYDVCSKTGLDTFVITEDQSIAKLVPSSIITPTCENGTERCMSVIDNLSYDRYINVQGDMPDITEEIIFAVEKKLENYLVATAYTSMSESERQNPNSVKIIHTKDKAHWFCRASLEYGDHHLGVYGYRNECSEIYQNSSKYQEEEIESLEQLRWIQNDVKIGVAKVEFNGIEINTIEDLTKWHYRNYP